MDGRSDAVAVRMTLVRTECDRAGTAGSARTPPFSLRQLLIAGRRWRQVRRWRQIEALLARLRVDRAIVVDAEIELLRRVFAWHALVSPLAFVGRKKEFGGDGHHFEVQLIGTLARDPFRDFTSLPIGIAPCVVCNG